MGEERGEAVMQLHVGSVAAFQPNKEQIESYLERLELFMIANKFPEDRRVPALIGSEAYEVLRNLLAPDLPQTKDSTVLTDTLKKHYSPKPLIIAEKFHFYRRTQQAEESTAEFEATLRKLALHCEFGTHLEEALLQISALSTFDGTVVAYHGCNG